MLSYYISWHMKQALAPILFQDNDKPASAAQRSDEALTKAARKRTEDDYPVQGFTSPLADPATICANQTQPTNDMPAFTILTTPPRCNGGPSNHSASPTDTVSRRQHTQPARPQNRWSQPNTSRR
jgi:hypothetical protein